MVFFNDFQKLGEPIVTRYQEAQERPKAFEALGASLVRVRKALDEYLQKVRATQVLFKFR